MIAAPWYLLSAGAILVVVGLILAALRRPSVDQTYIDFRMSDDEIAERLEQAKGDPLSKIVVVVGILLVLVSIIWRIVRVFL